MSEVRRLPVILKCRFAAPTLEEINRFLLLLLRNHRFECAARLVLQMNSNRIDRDDRTRSIFASALLQHCDVGKARSFVKSCSSGIDRNGVFDDLIRGLSFGRNADKAVAVMRDWMSAEGTVPLSSSGTRRSLIYSLSLQGLVDEAVEVLRWTSIDASICRFVFAELCRNGKTKLASEFQTKLETAFGFRFNLAGPVRVDDAEITDSFEELDAYECVIAGGLDSCPKLDLFDYAVMIKCLCEEDRLREALELCSLMEKNKKIGINIGIYNTIITSLCRQGCFTEAFRLFDSMEKTKMKPCEITYGILIDCLCREGHVDDARMMMEKMKDELNPNAHIYNSLINGYCNFGKMEEALAMLEEMEGRRLECDNFTVSYIINGYCRRGEAEQALSFLSLSVTRSPPDLVGFVCLMKCLRSKGRTEEARSLMSDMLRTESPMEAIRRIDDESQTSPSLEASLQLLCKYGDMDESIEALDEVSRVKKTGKRRRSHSKPELPNSYGFFYSRVHALCSQGKLDDAQRVVRETLSAI